MKSRIGFALVGSSLLSLALASGITVVQGQTTPPKIGTTLSLPTTRVHRGRTVRASLVLDVPSGYHVNAHEPISRFALPTKLEVEAPSGLKIGRIFYPKAIARRFSFSEDRLGVYENRVTITFTFTVPPNQSPGKVELKARLSYQSCSDEVCFPPVTREMTVAFMVS
jgi:DsbC/DsbD-like thiol-disulfide interchange protein